MIISSIAFHSTAIFRRFPSLPLNAFQYQPPLYRLKKKKRRASLRDRLEGWCYYNIEEYRSSTSIIIMLMSIHVVVVLLCILLNLLCVVWTLPLHQGGEEALCCRIHFTTPPAALLSSWIFRYILYHIYKKLCIPEYSVLLFVCTWNIYWWSVSPWRGISQDASVPNPGIPSIYSLSF